MTNEFVKSGLLFNRLVHLRKVERCAAEQLTGAVHL